MSSSPLSSRVIPTNIKLGALSLIRTPSHADHKGSSGRVVVIGGSKDYIGAPYFSAMASMRAGVDMATIVCPPAAAVPLKALSPDLIVRGLLVPPHQKEDSILPTTKASIEELESLKSKSHAFIIGPGLETDTSAAIDAGFVKWIEQSLILGKVDKNEKSSSLSPIIIDASGIGLLAESLALRGSQQNDEGKLLSPVIVTPNVNEIKILHKAAGKPSSNSLELSAEDMAVAVSKSMRCCILLKGMEDFIAIDGVGLGRVTLDVGNGKADSKKHKGLEELLGSEESSSLKPSARRSAGQGDILSGLVGTFLAWGNLNSKLPSDGPLVDYLKDISAADNVKILSHPPQLLVLNAAIGASIAMKYSALATEKRSRTTRFLTSDILTNVSEVIDCLVQN